MMTPRAEKYYEYLRRLKVVGYDGSDESLYRLGTSITLAKIEKVESTFQSSQTYQTDYLRKRSINQTFDYPRTYTVICDKAYLNKLYVYADDDNNGVIRLQDMFDGSLGINVYTSTQLPLNEIRIVGYSQQTDVTSILIRAAQRKCKILDLRDLRIEGIRTGSLFESSILEEIKMFNIDAKDTKEGINTRGLFQSSRALKRIDLNGVKFSTTIDFSRMFENCVNLEEIEFGDSLENVQYVDQAVGMFAGCWQLKKVNFGKFNGKILGPTYKMFSGASKSMQILTSSKEIQREYELYKTGYRGKQG